ncbi:hypothetical protein Bca52824_038859 [Brassica carinata]|uniref:Uncharacterized protein n=1 Tax=Brassica carinata TaxID=52824 RepID=A0A8X7RQ42_BRACI|nr:hypothetical protein Bca52824_038859 [Brassica carinata]
MLDQYHRHLAVDPPTISSSRLDIAARVSDPLNNNPAALIMASVVIDSSGDRDRGFNLRPLDLPAPCFTYWLGGSVRGVEDVVLRASQMEQMVKKVSEERLI